MCPPESGDPELLGLLAGHEDEQVRARVPRRIARGDAAQLVTVAGGDLAGGVTEAARLVEKKIKIDLVDAA